MEVHPTPVSCLLLNKSHKMYFVTTYKVLLDFWDDGEI